MLIKKGFTWAFLTICLFSCSTLSTGHGKQNQGDRRKKESQNDLKQLCSKELGNPEMVLISGAQKNDLNLEPLNVAMAPDEVYQTKAGEKPIVISVSNDKQVLSEENRILPNPILVNGGSVVDLDFLRQTLFGNSSLGKHSGTRPDFRTTNATTPSKNSPTEAKSGDLGQLKRNEMRPTLAALYRDETALDAAKSSSDTLDQSLSSDQLLCIIFKLLSMYKPNVTGPETIAGSNFQETSDLENPLTLRPTNKLPLNMARSKFSDAQQYKTPLLYHHFHPSDFPHSDITTEQKSGKRYPQGPSAGKAAEILDDIPLIKTFNKHTPSLSDELGMNISFPASESDLGIPFRNHKKEFLDRASRIRSHDVKSHDSVLRELAELSHEIPEKKFPLPAETLGLYSRLLEQVQDKNPSHHLDNLESTGNLIKTLSHIQRANSHGDNRTVIFPELDFFSSHQQKHPDTINFLRSVHQKERSGVKRTKEPHSILSDVVTQDLDPLNSYSWDPFETDLRSTAQIKGKKHKERQRGKKIRLKFKKRSKEERRKKTHDLDFLDLLSKSMIRESRNFIGRI
nr:PREDICTED: uncharacterized protein LOC109040562 [Bemisia tabaci]